MQKSSWQAVAHTLKVNLSLKIKKSLVSLGIPKKENINEILKIETPFYQIGDLEHIDSTIVEEFVGKSRAFIKIQEGCDFRCFLLYYSCCAW